MQSCFTRRSLPPARRFAIGVIVGLLCFEKANALYGQPSSRASAGGFSWSGGAYNLRDKWTTGPQVDDLQIFFEGSRGLWETTEVYARVGVSNIVINEALDFPADPGAGDVSPNSFLGYFGAGIRGELWATDYFVIGGSAEWTSHSEFTDTLVPPEQDALYVVWVEEVDQFNLTISIGTQIHGVEVYAGPTIHLGFISGVVEKHELDVGGTTITRDVLTIRDKGSVGSVVGTIFDLSLGRLILEGRITDNVGGGLTLYNAW